MQERISFNPEIGKYQKKKNTIIKRANRDKYLLIMLIPVVAYYLIFHYIPMYGATIAFKNYNMFEGIFKSPWVGLANFKRIFSTSDFYTVLTNTLRLNFLSLIFGFPSPIILALLLNELRNAIFKRTVQTIAYLPHFLSWVVVANMFIPMLSPSSGLINNIITALGGEAIYFMADKYWWIVVYVALGIWKETGWGAIIYLAALTGIDQQLYEAATIDGANKWKQLLHVTLPGISSTITVVLILNIGRMMSIGFDQPYLLGNGSVIEISDVISTYVYRLGLQSADISRSTAIGLFQSVVNLIMLFATNYLSKRISGEGIY